MPQTENRVTVHCPTAQKRPRVPWAAARAGAGFGGAAGRRGDGRAPPSGRNRARPLATRPANQLRVFEPLRVVVQRQLCLAQSDQRRHRPRPMPEIAIEELHQRCRGLVVHFPEAGDNVAVPAMWKARCSPKTPSPPATSPSPVSQAESTANSRLSRRQTWQWPGRENAAVALRDAELVLLPRQVRPGQDQPGKDQRVAAGDRGSLALAETNLLLEGASGSWNAERNFCRRRSRA